MIRNKPSRKPGQDLRSVPTYTIPEAANILAISPRTMFSWYEGADPILKSSGSVGEIHLLSYRDIEEAYRVYLLREEYKFSLQFLRRSMMNARKMFNSKHPLKRADAVKECFKDLVYDKPARAGKPRTITSLGRSPGQQVVREVVDLFASRIVVDEFIFPWRFAAKDHETRPVSMNPDIFSGRLVVIGTRIPANVLLGSKRAGFTTAAIANDYGLEADIVEKALIHLGLRQEAA